MREATVQVRSTDPPAPGEVHVFLRYGGSPPLSVGVSLAGQWEAEVALWPQDAARLLEALRRVVGPVGEEGVPATGESATLGFRDAQGGEQAHISVASTETVVTIGVARRADAERREVVVARELVRALTYQLEAALQWVSRYRPVG